jgi:hypothetical protein
VLAIANGETVRTDRAIFDTTNPEALGVAAPGTQVIAARRDHVHAAPASLHTQNTDTGTTGNTFSIDSDSVLGKIILDVALGAADKSLTLTNAALTDNRTITFPDSTGTVALTGAAPTAHAASHITGGGDTIAIAVAGGAAGLMTGADKTRLDGIESGADVTDAANVLAALAEPAADVVFNEAGHDHDFRVEGVGAANAFFVRGSDGNVGFGTSAATYQVTQKSSAAAESATLGAELLAAGDTWVLGANWAGSFGAGFAHTPGSTATLENTTVVPTATNKYQITYTVTGRTAGSFTITFGSVTSGSFTANGAWGPTATGAGTLVITPTSTFDGTIVISIKQITAGYSPSYSIFNAAGSSVFEIRSSSLGNCFTGMGVGQYNTTGYTNAAFGTSALGSNTTGYYNVAFGTGALYLNTTGSANAAFGSGALYLNTTGYNNVAFGVNALNLNTTGYHNVAFGASALYLNTTGYYNVAFGASAGRYITDGTTANATGNTSLFLGYDTRAAADGQTNQIVIGVSNIGLGSNTVVLGNSSIVTTALRGSVGIGQETAPGTLLDMAGTAPYITIHNTTHEDGAGGREGKLIFEGEQSGGELTTLGEIEICHDGASDDEKGKLIVRLNDGNDVTSPTVRLTLQADGGLILATIKSGATQGAAGAAAGELWKTASHATLPDNVVMIGV